MLRLILRLGLIFEETRYLYKLFLCDFFLSNFIEKQLFFNNLVKIAAKLCFNLVILRRQSVIHCWVAWRISVPCSLLSNSASAILVMWKLLLGFENHFPHFILNTQLFKKIHLKKIIVDIVFNFTVYVEFCKYIAKCKRWRYLKTI